MLTYFLAWFLMLMIAIGNGTLREFVFKKHLDELKAHQLSTFSLLVFFSGFIFFLFKIFPPPTLLIAILVGIMWMALTEIFEFAFGLVRHLS